MTCLRVITSFKLAPNEGALHPGRSAEASDSNTGQIYCMIRRMRAAAVSHGDVPVSRK